MSLAILATRRVSIKLRRETGSDFVAARGREPESRSVVSPVSTLFGAWNRGDVNVRRHVGRIGGRLLLRLQFLLLLRAICTKADEGRYRQDPG